MRGLLLGGVRQGAQDGVMLAAIAKAADVPLSAVQRAAMLAGFAGPVAVAALTGGQDALAAVSVEVGRPLRPMLAGSAPEVAAAMALPAGTAILDGETVAVRPDGRPEPFQVTGARTASTADPAQLRASTPLATSFFDLLHIDGEDLLDRPLHERVARLHTVIPAAATIPRITTDSPEEATTFFAAQVAAGHEGVIVKDPTSPYAAGRRGAGWIKVKPRHTLDLVVLAVEWGSGRRRGTLSNIGGDGCAVAHAIALRFARVVRYRDDKTAAEADTIDTVRLLRGW